MSNDEAKQDLFEAAPADYTNSAENPPSTSNKAVPHYHGHRERLRERFSQSGPDALADYELLEMLLYRLIPRQDTKPVAKDLLAKFGSLSAVLGASEHELKQVKKIGAMAACDLKVIAAISQRSLATGLRDKTLLGSWSSVIEYCTSAMAHETIEQFRILFLDKKNHLIKDEVQQKGTIDHTPVYPREVIKRALELSASALILVHNHPSGDPTPSRADIDMTNVIIQSAKPMGIVVHDHIIIGKDGHVSMKALQLI